MLSSITSLKYDVQLLNHWMNIAFNRNGSSLLDHWIPLHNLYKLFSHHLEGTGIEPPSCHRFSYNLRSSKNGYNVAKKTVGKYHTTYYIVLSSTDKVDFSIHMNDIYPTLHRPIRRHDTAARFLRYITDRRYQQQNEGGMISNDNSTTAVITTRSGRNSIHHCSSEQVVSTNKPEQTPTSSPQAPTRAPTQAPTDTPTPVSPQVSSPSLPPSTTTLLNSALAVKARLESYIDQSSSLDFSINPRPDCRDETYPPIELRSRTRMTTGMKWNMLATLNSFNFQSMSGKRRLVAANAVASTEAYFAGFKSAPSGHSLVRWWNDYMRKRNQSEYSRIDTFFNSREGQGRMTYVASIEKNYPRYLHSLYRYATKTLGVDSNVNLLVSLMNSKARMEHPFCPVRSRLKLTPKHFWIFFHHHGGQLKNPVTKPELKKKHIVARLDWAKRNLKKAILHDKDTDGTNKFWRCFLDEKWMYTTSRRKKLKILPPAAWEDPQEVEVLFPKIRNRRFPCKVMYLGVIAPPAPEYNFEGKIMLKRISKDRVQQINSFNTKVSDSQVVNSLISSGDWRNLVLQHSDMPISSLIDLMQDRYHFDNDIASRLVFSYRSYPMRCGPKSSKSVKRMDDRHNLLLGNRKIRVSPDAPILPLSVDHIFLEVKVMKGTVLQEDCSCDTAFMKGLMKELGTAIRSSFHWVAPEVEVTLVMDNAGGHGTNVFKDEFVAYLKTHHNVQVEWQVGQSPETNLLDLGIWMSFQSLVERMHQFLVIKPDVLDKTVCKAWMVFNGFDKFARVDKRWKEVLALIIEDKGGNDKVEQCRNKLSKLERLTPIMAATEGGTTRDYEELFADEGNNSDDDSWSSDNEEEAGF